jgi:hypothetical protein
VLLIISSLGVQTASGLSYALGPRFAWMAESHALIAGLNIGLCGWRSCASPFSPRRGLVIPGLKGASTLLCGYRSGLVTRSHTFS